MGSFHRPPLLNDGTFRERKQEEAETDRGREEGGGGQDHSHIAQKRGDHFCIDETACMPERKGLGTIESMLLPWHPTVNSKI